MSPRCVSKNKIHFPFASAWVKRVAWINFLRHLNNGVWPNTWLRRIVITHKKRRISVSLACRSSSQKQCNASAVNRGVLRLNKESGMILTYVKLSCFPSIDTAETTITRSLSMGKGGRVQQFRINTFLNLGHLFYFFTKWINFMDEGRKKYSTIVKSKPREQV